MEQDPTNPKIFVSERHRLADEKARRIAAFDFLADLAIDGMITLDEAVDQYKTELAETQNPAII